MVNYDPQQPERADLDSTSGPLVVGFGTEWCGFCQGADPFITAALAEHPQVEFQGVEDGPGRALGRSYKVKLWPTLVFLRDGQEIDRVVRPSSQAEVADGLAKIVAPTE